MTNPALSVAIQNMVNDVIENSKGAISEAMVSGLAEHQLLVDRDVSTVIGIVSMNTLKISTALAVQMTLQYLENMGLIKLSDDPSICWDVIKGGKD
ncbi:MAG: hypothetical protein VB096_10365 [Pseudoflavonifractor sp.]|nr:hypothetical protein [Pseudoflavonifractor sp.]